MADHIFGLGGTLPCHATHCSPLYRIVTLIGCDDVATKPATPPPEPTPATEQTWLCGREYVNQAWGYQRRGVVLDTAGNIWKYDIKSSPTALVNPWGPKDMANMSEEELKLRYNGAMVTGKVPIEEIAEHLALIAEAAKAKPTEPKGVGADMGANVLYCYTYDAAKRSYAQVLLDQKGDFESDQSIASGEDAGHVAEREDWARSDRLDIADLERTPQLGGVRAEPLADNRFAHALHQVLIVGQVVPGEQHRRQNLVRLHEVMQIGARIARGKPDSGRPRRAAADRPYAAHCAD